MKKVIVSSNKNQTKFVIKEHFKGTKNATELFTDILISEISGKGWILEQKCGIMGTPTIPNQVVPNERS